MALSGTANAAGELVLTIRPPRQQTWTVSQVSVECLTAPGGATCDIRLSGRLVAPAVPQQDAVSGDPPVIVRPSETLQVVWAGLTPGDPGAALVFYDDGT